MWNPHVSKFSNDPNSIINKAMHAFKYCDGNKGILGFACMQIALCQSNFTSTRNRFYWMGLRVRTRVQDEHSHASRVMSLCRESSLPRRSSKSVESGKQLSTSLISEVSIWEKDKYYNIEFPWDSPIDFMSNNNWLCSCSIVMWTTYTTTNEIYKMVCAICYVAQRALKVIIWSHRRTFLYCYCSFHKNTSYVRKCSSSSKLLFMLSTLSTFGLGAQHNVHHQEKIHFKKRKSNIGHHDWTTLLVKMNIEHYWSTT